MRVVKNLPEEKISDKQSQDVLSPYVKVTMIQINQSSKIQSLLKRRPGRVRNGTRTIGKGRISEVRSIQSGRDRLAVKLISRQICNDQISETLTNESRTLKEIDHPHITRIKGVMIDEQSIGIVMNWASNGDLFAYLTRNGPSNEALSRKWLAQLVSAVDELHGQCIVHRDIKLENILVDGNDNLILTDFEMCHNFRQQGFPMMSESCGSPTYCPPEVIISSDRYYDGCKADVWASGITIYACVAGYLPFDDLKYPSTTTEEIRALYEHIAMTELHFPPWFSDESKDLLSQMSNKCYWMRASIVDVKAHRWLSEYTSLWAQSDSKSRNHYVSWASSMKLRKIIDRCMKPGGQVVRAPVIWDPHVGL